MSVFKAGLLLALERAVNTGLIYDAAAGAQLQALDGKVLHIACTAPVQSVYVLFVGRHVECWSLFEGATDTTLSGSASAFLRLWRGRGKTTALIDSGVSLTGDSEPLQHLQKISQHLDIDWEALIAAHTGDIVAHQLGRTLRGAGRWFEQARHEAARLVSEYLQYENRTVPSRHEVQNFCRDVDELQLSMDRLQARMDLLPPPKKAQQSEDDL